MNATPTHTRRTLFIDIMLDGRFLFTMPYRYSPLFKLDLRDIYGKVIARRPSLKDKPFEMHID